MSKRKATTDIHPDARDDSPVIHRLKAGGLEFPTNNVSKPSAITSPALDVGTALQLETLTPKLSHRNTLEQKNNGTSRASIAEPGPSIGEVPSSSQQDCDPTTMRSRYFMENMAELNRSFAAWINECIKEDPTAIFTRVFIDHQRQVQALFNEERERTKDLDKLLVLRAQEKVLHQLKEADDDDDSSSCDSNSEEEISLINGEAAVTATSPVTITPAVVSAPSAAPSAALPIFNPFLNNNVLNGLKPLPPASKETDQVDDVAKDLGPKLPTGPVADKPINFGSFSFARACSEAAAKAAAAKEQESEENNDDSPPKVEFTPVQEEGAVYTKRCKIFFKKEKVDGYEDRGIGNMFVKPVESSNRHQLIVRSETSLGNLLVNVLLSPEIPIKKMGEKNVMLVMVPTPGATVRIVMIRVKDGVDDMVENLTKFSKI